LGSATPAGAIDLAGTGVAADFGVAAGGLLGFDDGDGVAGADVATVAAGSSHAVRHRRQMATHPNPSLVWLITLPLPELIHRR
jgi:hypothetical protein